MRCVRRVLTIENPLTMQDSHGVTDLYVIRTHSHWPLFRFPGVPPLIALAVLLWPVSLRN